MKEKILIVTSFMGGLIANALGGFDTILITFLITMSVDYFFGVLCALTKQEYSWTIGAIGISKKFALLIIVALGQTLDHALGTDAIIRLSILMFYIANELISIIEHMIVLDIPVPSILEKVAEIFKEKGDTDL